MARMGRHLASPMHDQPEQAAHAKAMPSEHHGGKRIASPAGTSVPAGYENPTPDVGHKAHKLFGHKRQSPGV